MPIKSYLAHPQAGKKNDLIKDLLAIAHCEVIPAQNKDLIVLITDTESESDEDIIKQKLESIHSLKLLALVSGFNTSKNEL
jgi:nitrate reductase NapAB chaperone NapD